MITLCLCETLVYFEKLWEIVSINDFSSESRLPAKKGRDLKGFHGFHGF